MPDGKPTEGPGPLDRVPGRHHPQLEAPVVRLRLREGLDPAEYLPDVRGQHARHLAGEEALAVYLHGRLRRADREVPDPGDDVGGTTQLVLRAPVGVRDHPGVKARARHHHEALAVDRSGVQPSPVPVQPDLHRLGEIGWHLEVRRQQVRGPGGQDRHRRAGPRHRVDAALDRAVAAPDEQHVNPFGGGPARVLGRAPALVHLVPQRVGDAFPGQDLPQFRQPAAETLACVRHHGNISHLSQTFRQRASHSPYTPNTRRPSAASSIRNSPNGSFRRVSSALSMPPESDAL
jgi:hypothetical protein